MSDLLVLAVSSLAGVVLGLGFFFGLWWTVQRALCSELPAVWLLASLIVRSTCLLAGFHWVAAGHWPRLLACLAGCVCGRSLVKRWSAPRGRPAAALGASHAP